MVIPTVASKSYGKCEILFFPSSACIIEFVYVRNCEHARAYLCCAACFFFLLMRACARFVGKLKTMNHSCRERVIFLFITYTDLEKKRKNGGILWSALMAVNKIRLVTHKCFETLLLCA